MNATKLRPEDLTSEERAIWDQVALDTWRAGMSCPNECHEAAREVANDLILARRALFAPAPVEAEKVECPNCGGPEDHWMYEDDDGARYSCQPAQPGPAEPNWKDLDTGAKLAEHFSQVPSRDLSANPADWTPEPAAPEMPEAVRMAVARLRDYAKKLPIGGSFDLRVRAAVNTEAAALESWWKDNDKAIRILVRNSAQPVRMTEELEALLLMCDEFCRIKTFPGKESFAAAIAAVRQQAAQPVRLEKVRELLEHLDTEIGFSNKIDVLVQAAFAELDAHEGKGEGRG